MEVIWGPGQPALVALPACQAHARPFSTYARPNVEVCATRKVCGPGAECRWQPRGCHHGQCPAHLCIVSSQGLRHRTTWSSFRMRVAAAWASPWVAPSTFLAAAWRSTQCSNGTGGCRQLPHRSEVVGGMSARVCERATGPFREVLSAEFCPGCLLGAHTGHNAHASRVVCRHCVLEVHYIPTGTASHAPVCTLLSAAFYFLQAVCRQH